GGGPTTTRPGGSDGIRQDRGRAPARPETPGRGGVGGLDGGLPGDGRRYREGNAPAASPGPTPPPGRRGGGRDLLGGPVSGPGRAGPSRDPGSRFQGPVGGRVGAVLPRGRGRADLSGNRPRHPRDIGERGGERRAGRSVPAAPVVGSRRGRQDRAGKRP